MTALVEPRVVRWTRQEYYRMAEAGLFDGRRVELIRGEVVEMSPQSSEHATAVSLGCEALRAVFRRGFYVRSQLPLILGKDSDPEPDLAVARGQPRDDLRTHPSMAVLLVEVSLTTLEFDRNTKGPLYAEAAIPEYWIVNLVEEIVEVYRRPGRDGRRGAYRYASCEPYSRGQTITPLGAPRARVKVSDLLP